MSIKLTIVIPVFQVEDTLERCLESIVRQSSFPDTEIVLIDDGSTDKSGDICDKWAQENQGITVVHQANSGLSAARNMGIEKARGEFLMFVDSDDFIADGTIEALVRRMDEHQEWAMLEFPIFKFYGAPQEKMLKFKEKVYTNMQQYWFEGKAYTHAYACNKIYRREVFEQVRFPVGKKFEDLHVLPLILKQAKSVATCAQGCYHYCFNPDGITYKADGGALANLLEAHLKYLDENGEGIDKTSVAFAQYYAHVLNIQLDVYKKTANILLPWIKVKPVTWKTRLNNIIGIRKFCQFNQLIHNLSIWRNH